MTFQKVTLTFELSIDSFNDLKMDTNLKLRKWTMTLTFMIFFFNDFYLNSWRPFIEFITHDFSIHDTFNWYSLFWFRPIRIPEEYVLKIQKRHYLVTCKLFFLLSHI